MLLSAARGERLASDLDIFVPRPSSAEFRHPPSIDKAPTLVIARALEVITEFADPTGSVEWLVSHFQQRHSKQPPGYDTTGAANVHSLRLRCRSAGGVCAGKASPPRLGMDESYSLSVQVGQAAVLAASSRAGLARGLETFLQLTHAQPGHLERGSQLLIEDQPRTAWRGLLVDVSRHFMPMALLRRTLVEMATFKLNVLHLHLTDAGMSHPLHTVISGRTDHPRRARSILSDPAGVSPRAGEARGLLGRQGVLAGRLDGDSRARGQPLNTCGTISVK